MLCLSHNENNHLMSAKQGVSEVLGRRPFPSSTDRTHGFLRLVVAFRLLQGLCLTGRSLPLARLCLDADFLHEPSRLPVPILSRVRHYNAMRIPSVRATSSGRTTAQISSCSNRKVAFCCHRVGSSTYDHTVQKVGTALPAHAIATESPCLLFSALATNSGHQQAAMKFQAIVAFLAGASLVAARFPATPIAELRKHTRSSSSGLVKRADVDPSLLYAEHNLPVPIDHFHNESIYEPHSNGKFNLRYWFDDTYYKPGGPVIVLSGGETDATERLTFLQKGIVYLLCKATGGLGVILEHRYYGTSMPTADLSTKNLRFLTTDQALADTAYFAQHVVFKGHEHQDLTSKGAPWIAYGGSYAGAFVAFLRKLYPQVFFGAISSSGVTKAIYDYWQYYEPVRQYGPRDCVHNTQLLTNVVDKILIGKKGTSAVADLKKLFGLGDIKYDTDFANVISYGIAGWQGRNWDPEVNDPSFSEYCGNLTSKKVQYPATNALKGRIQSTLRSAGYGAQARALTVPFQNYIGYVNQTIVQPCLPESLDECYTTHNATYYAQDDLSQEWRSWPYQYCTQWGFLQTGSDVPKKQLSMISRTIDLDFTSIICRDAFNITKPSDTGAINKHGGFDISYPRLAFVDGEVDPWRPATPHAPAAKPRRSTASEPFILIADAVHHWDENSLFPNQTTRSLPPHPVAHAQKLEIQFVKKWLQDAVPVYGGK
ncbi:hypothetical protein FH972_023185 [Carpinus fangiana]|uniref:Serine carboxypeptidase S28 family protein n=1 Tax=Carpinus fangiana TaxID=176857 RepID=A0A5N6KUG1_9ROSI|nr:hypothetical protein FH972_023185 [Carpinus fangiana]